ncbi:helix-turn-helix transcriptional regulator [Mailhella massiliensis]|uniref:helix-turn-helix transcriptional regulator n=1 Tax=Mailhella massiliensis TaxID=1903261 RepID=UPI00097D48FE|nr:AlpA family phage regulatory protein [Mailhella massiliensis]
MSNLENESLLRLPQVLKIIPISKSAWWQGCKDGRYPQPIKLGPRTTVWKASDISAFMRQLSRSPVQNESNGVKQ